GYGTDHLILLHVLPNRDYHFAIRVKDQAGNQTVSDDSTFQDANRSLPQLDPIADRSVKEGNLLSFTAHATYAGTLTCTLGPGAPAGARIDPVSGVFTWTPTEAHGPGSYNLTVQASDSQTPALSVARSFTVTVN